MKRTKGLISIGLSAALLLGLGGCASSIMLPFYMISAQKAEEYYEKVVNAENLASHAENYSVNFGFRSDYNSEIWEEAEMVKSGEKYAIYGENDKTVTYHTEGTELAFSISELTESAEAKTFSDSKYAIRAEAAVQNICNFIADPQNEPYYIAGLRIPSFSASSELYDYAVQARYESPEIGGVTYNELHVYLETDKEGEKFCISFSYGAQQYTSPYDDHYRIVLEEPFDFDKEWIEKEYINKKEMLLNPYWSDEEESDDKTENSANIEEENQ